MSDVENVARLALGIQIVSSIQGKPLEEQVEILMSALFQVAYPTPNKEKTVDANEQQDG